MTSVHVHVVRMWVYENSSAHMTCHLFDAMPTRNAGKVQPFQLNYLNTRNDRLTKKNWDLKLMKAIVFFPVSLDVRSKTRISAVLFFQEENLRAN